MLIRSRRSLIDSGLLDEKPGFEPQVRHQNKMQKVLLRRFPLSRFLAKTMNATKIAMKSFSKKSVVRSRLSTAGPAIYV